VGVRAGLPFRGENVGVNRPQLILAGYVLAVPALRPPGHEQVLAEEFLTISDCLMADLPRPEFWDWFVHHGDATSARQSLAPEADVLAVAMTPGDADGLMREQGGAEQPYFELLRTRQPLPIEVDLLGFEIVGAEWTLDFHSWHCHGYAPQACPQLDVQLNDSGLIATYHDAVKLLDWMLAQPPENQPKPVEWTVVAIART
jgi:hypothetical protein